MKEGNMVLSLWISISQCMNELNYLFTKDIRVV